MRHNILFTGNNRLLFAIIIADTDAGFRSSIIGVEISGLRFSIIIVDTEADL
jgi:hypothetical protein